VKYEVAGEAKRFYDCHCSRCRKATGTGHASNLFLQPAALRWRYHPKKRELQAEWPGAVLMNTRRLRLTPIGLGRVSLGCLVAAAWGAYGDAPTTTPPPHWFISGQESAQAIKEYSEAIDHTNAWRQPASVDTR
jgi:hypothetical protein